MKDPIKVFLVQMPYATTEPSITLAQLRAVLTEAGFASELLDVSIALYHRRRDTTPNVWSDETGTIWGEVEFVHRFLEADRAFIGSRFLSPIVDAPRPVVGFAVSGNSLVATRWLARAIKEQRRDAFIVLGGQLFTKYPKIMDDLDGEPAIDAVVEGDGEATLVELASRLQEGRPLEACAGMRLRDEDGRLRSTGARPPVDLDRLPFADFSPFDLSLYGSHNIRGDTLPMMASRGCVWRCHFCGNRQGWKGFRQMSGDRMFHEIVHQRRTVPGFRLPTSEVKFYDLVVNGDVKKLSRLCDLLIAERSEAVWTECNAIIRPEMTDELCRKLHRAGCRTLIIGLESGSQKVLDSMRKPQKLEDMKRVLRSIDRAGLKTRGNFMFGYPGETEEDFEGTLRFLREMHPYIHVVYPSYSFTHIEGSLEDDPDRFDVVPDKNALYWESKDGSNTYPVRLDRFRRFRELAKSLGACLGDGLKMPIEAYVDFSLGGYYESKGAPERALASYRDCLRSDPGNAYVLSKVSELERGPAPAASLNGGEPASRPGARGGWRGLLEKAAAALGAAFGASGLR